MLAHVLGLDNGSGPWYLFWSGFGSDLSEITGLGAVAYIFWRKHNCHTPGCWRIGRHESEGRVLCHRHAVAR